MCMGAYSLSLSPNSVVEMIIYKSVYIIILICLTFVLCILMSKLELSSYMYHFLIVFSYWSGPLFCTSFYYVSLFH